MFEEKNIMICDAIYSRFFFILFMIHFLHKILVSIQTYKRWRGGDFGFLWANYAFQKFDGIFRLGTWFRFDGIFRIGNWFRFFGLLLNRSSYSNSVDLFTSISVESRLVWALVSTKGFFVWRFMCSWFQTEMNSCDIWPQFISKLSQDLDIALAKKAKVMKTVS